MLVVCWRAKRALIRFVVRADDGNRSSAPRDKHCILLDTPFFGMHDLAAPHVTVGRRYACFDYSCSLSLPSLFTPG